MQIRSVILVAAFLALLAVVSARSVAAQDTGFIQVQCEPGIQIFLDGTLKGLSNSDQGGLVIEAVPAGEWLVRALKPGFTPQERRVRVSKGGEIVVVKFEVLIPKPPEPTSKAPEPAKISGPDLSWTSAFPNRVSESAMNNLLVTLQQSTKVKGDKMLSETFRAALASATREQVVAVWAIWMIQEQQRPATWERGYLIEHLTVPKVESTRVDLWPVSIFQSSGHQDLYRALRGCSSSVRYVCGFDLEVGPIDKENPRNFLPGADIQNPVYCHVRTLMITEVLGGSVLDKQALEPFIGRKIEFGAKTTETTSDIAEPRAQEARGAEQRRQAGEALVAAGGVVVDLGGGVTMNMVAIKTGKFMMGSPDGQGANSERPVHPVEITEPFWLGQTEVTQAQWQAVMGNNPSDRKGSDRPVVKVSWNDATEFCKRLSEKTGMKFRLPTEAEWEYACRGGTTTAFHGFTGYLSGTNDYTLVGNIAWFLENRGAWGTPTYGTKAVGQKAANGFGLHDMSGNVWEFVNDWYSSSYYASSPSSNPTGPASGSSRVIRGGSWDSGALNVRSSARGYRTDPGIDVGFRVARTP